jgi:hypothetical protein
MCHFGAKEILLPVKYYVSAGCKISFSTKIRKIVQTRKKTSRLAGRVVFLNEENHTLFRVSLKTFCVS